jgi:hypothetical protein
MQGTSKNELLSELDRCARLCEETAAVYVERHGDRAGADTVSALLLAGAALQTAGKAAEAGGPSAKTALLIAATLVDDALAAAERRGLDESLLHCVIGLRRVAELLAEELAA